MNANHTEVTPSGSCLVCGDSAEFKAWGADGKVGVCLKCFEARYALEQMRQQISELRSILQPLQNSPNPNLLAIREALQILRR